MTDLSRERRHAVPPVAPTPEGRRWIALAMEAQYGADARETDYARTLWRRSLARRADDVKPAARGARAA
jgi:hypothetical protein